MNSNQTYWLEVNKVDVVDQTFAAQMDVFFKISLLFILSTERGIMYTMNPSHLRPEENQKLM